MLSKEEIEDIIESKFNNSEEENFGLTVEEAKHIALYEKKIHYCDALTQATYNILLQYIEQLETKEQKLIEKLEETIDFVKTDKSKESKIKAEVLQNVLKIVKESNNKYATKERRYKGNEM